MQILRKKRRNLKKILLASFLAFAIYVATFSALFFTNRFFFHKQALIKPLPTLAIQNPVAIENAASALEKLLSAGNISYTSIQIASNSSVLITLKTGEQILFDETKKLDEQITSLQLIMRQLTIEGKRFTRIDLRFDNPVVSF